MQPSMGHGRLRLLSRLLCLVCTQIISTHRLQIAICGPRNRANQIAPTATGLSIYHGTRASLALLAFHPPISKLVPRQYRVIQLCRVRSGNKSPYTCLGRRSFLRASSCLSHNPFFRESVYSMQSRTEMTTRYCRRSRVGVGESDVWSTSQ